MCLMSASDVAWTAEAARAAHTGLLVDLILTVKCLLLESNRMNGKS